MYLSTLDLLLPCRIMHVILTLPPPDAVNLHESCLPRPLDILHPQLEEIHLDRDGPLHGQVGVVLGHMNPLLHLTTLARYPLTMGITDNTEQIMYHSEYK